MDIKISDRFTKELPADPNRNNSRRQVLGACFSYVKPRVPGDPKLVHVSAEMAANLGFSDADLRSDAFRDVFSGARVLDGSDPYAMCYGGHQFGHWAGQLGDGRAINLAEIEARGERWTLQLKGAGETPYSRSADGLAVLRSSIREHLCSEAMYHLGVPTTRSLSLCLSGDEVMRDMLYDGNAAFEKGAIVCRVAPSFLRFGNFQIFAARGDMENLKSLVDYTIEQHFPEVLERGKQGYIDFFNSVLDRTLKMIIEWQRVGFVHGVMNTDNMSILGLTIDYGPYGWLEGYDRDWTPNTTDAQHARYRFGHQPSVALWNLYQLANALYPLVEDTAPFEQALQRYKSDFSIAYAKMMAAKIGLSKRLEGDDQLRGSLQATLGLIETDMTIFFRSLSQVGMDMQAGQALAQVLEAFYDPEALEGAVKKAWLDWFGAYLLRLQEEATNDEERKTAMDLVNPKYVLRNYMAQLAIDAADGGDYSVIEELYELLRKPYAEQSGSEKWFAKRPEWARHKVGCSMLSCSS